MPARFSDFTHRYINARETLYDPEPEDNDIGANWDFLFALLSIFFIVAIGAGITWILTLVLYLG